nr:unnamed protein product [Naegleria fowleri]
MYGKLTIVLLNFLEFNIVKNLAHLYGTQPCHWYFSQGFPVILLSYLPFYIWINYFNKEFRAKYFKLNVVILFPIVLYSFQTHKEFRFIYPIVPLCFISVAEYCCNKFEQEQKNFMSSFKIVLVFVICVQIAAALYLGKIHQNGPQQVMDYLRMEYYNYERRNSSSDGQDSSLRVHLLMPCHHTPGYSFLHHQHLFSKGIQLYHLDCSPFDGNNTQADQFYRDPVGFTLNQSKTIENADYVVMYDTMSKTLQPVLKNHFSFAKQAFHMHMFMLHDSRMGQYMDIWKKTR